MLSADNELSWTRYIIEDPSTHPTGLQRIEVECKDGRRYVGLYSNDAQLFTSIGYESPPAEADFVRWRPEREVSLAPPHNQAFQFLGLRTLIHASAQSTNGAFGLVEHPFMTPGFASPYHMHHREDESFYVIEGEVAFVLNGAWKRVGPGDFVYGPREIPHGFKIVGGAPARMLILCTPAGFEDFVLELARPLDDPPAPPEMGKLIAAATRAGIDILGPLPEEPA